MSANTVDMSDGHAGGGSRGDDAGGRSVPRRRRSPWVRQYPASVTLLYAKDWLATRLAPAGRKGETCPLCEQRVASRWRPLSRGMAYVLVRLHRQHGREWVRLEQFVDSLGIAHSDEHRLRHWGLIEPAGQDDGQPAGSYRVTPVGAAFARGEARVPLVAHLLNNRCYALDGDLVTVDDVLGDGQPPVQSLRLERDTPESGLP